MASVDKRSSKSEDGQSKASTAPLKDQPERTPAEISALNRKVLDDGIAGIKKWNKTIEDLIGNKVQVLRNNHTNAALLAAMKQSDGSYAVTEANSDEVFKAGLSTYTDVVKKLDPNLSDKKGMFSTVPSGLDFATDYWFGGKETMKRVGQTYADMVSKAGAVDTSRTAELFMPIAQQLYGKMNQAAQYELQIGFYRHLETGDGLVTKDADGKYTLTDNANVALSRRYQTDVKKTYSPEDVLSQIFQSI